MRVVELYRDLWNGNELQEECTSSPSWDQVERAIREMDQAGRTLVSLMMPDGVQMTVGGGIGSFVVSIDSEAMHRTLHCHDDTGQEELVTCGGQTGVFANSCVVDLKTALLVADFFCIYGRAMPMPNYQWRDQ